MTVAGRGAGTAPLVDYNASIFGERGHLSIGNSDCGFRCTPCCMLCVFERPRLPNGTPQLVKQVRTAIDSWNKILSLCVACCRCFFFYRVAIVRVIRVNLFRGVSAFYGCLSSITFGSIALYKIICSRPARSLPPRGGGGRGGKPAGRFNRGNSVPCPSADVEHNLASSGRPAFPVLRIVRVGLHKRLRWWNNMAVIGFFSSHCHFPLYSYR